MTKNLYCPNVLNLGDFLNCMPVVSGLYKTWNEPLKFVVPDSMKIIKGFREFMEYQPMFDSVYFRSEILNMDESKYTIITYSKEEFRGLTERPNRPIETNRHREFLNVYYPELEFEVDDDFYFMVDDLDLSSVPDYTPEKIIVADRWSKVTDTRRNHSIFANNSKFQDKNNYYFFDYENLSLMQVAKMFYDAEFPNYVTFTGSGMLADLIENTSNRVCWDDSMIYWNNAPIEYSYWKHFYANRSNTLHSVKEFL